MQDIVSKKRPTEQLLPYFNIVTMLVY